MVAIKEWEDRWYLKTLARLTNQMCLSVYLFLLLFIKWSLSVMMAFLWLQPLDFLRLSRDKIKINSWIVKLEINR
jgi:hypothetical protein